MRQAATVHRESKPVLPSAYLWLMILYVCFDITCRTLIKSQSGLLRMSKYLGDVSDSCQKEKVLFQSFILN